MGHHDLLRLDLQVVTQNLLYTYAVFRKSLQHLIRSSRQMLIFTGMLDGLRQTISMKKLATSIEYCLL